MRVLLTPQEFKGTLTAVEAAEAIAVALRREFPDISIDFLPMADGGPGTLDALLASAGGTRRHSPAHDPLMRAIEAEWGILADGTAVVECASASGLLRLRPDELDPVRASSYGTGELIAAALDAGCTNVLIGLGGSATTDGGAGMAQALGFRLLDERGRDVTPGGAALSNLARIDVSDVDPALTHAVFAAATDVTNPLCGQEGAAAIYGPQKGASAEQVRQLDDGLRRLAEVMRKDLGVEVLDVEGAGAAGGLGAGVIAFLGGHLRPGAALIGEAAKLRQRVEAADFAVTGEGRLDGQTAFGKAPGHVAREARAAGKPIVCVAGALGPGHETAAPFFDAVEVTQGGGGGALPAKDEAARQVGDAAARGVRRLLSLR